MSELQTLETQINNWLLEEGLTISKQEDPKSDFRFLIPNAYNLGFPISIIKVKNKPIIAVGMGSKIPPEIKEGLKKLKPDDFARFLMDLQKELLKFGVEHAIRPSKKDPDLIEISDSLYVEEMTRTSFMEKIKKVKHASLFFIWSLTSKISPEKNPSGSPTAYG